MTAADLQAMIADELAHIPDEPDASSAGHQAEARLVYGNRRRGRPHQHRAAVMASVAADIGRRYGGAAVRFDLAYFTGGEE